MRLPEMNILNGKGGIIDIDVNFYGYNRAYARFIVPFRMGGVKYVGLNGEFSVRNCVVKSKEKNYASFLWRNQWVRAGCR
jgi:hypothetical protein